MWSENGFIWSEYIYDGRFTYNCATSGQDMDQIGIFFGWRVQ